MDEPGAEMPGHEDHAVIDDLVGDGHGLARIAGIVAHRQRHLFAQDAAGGVDVGDASSAPFFICSPNEAY
jgi:hypothetical protein